MMSAEGYVFFCVGVVGFWNEWLAEAKLDPSNSNFSSQHVVIVCWWRASQRSVENLLYVTILCISD